MYCTSLTLVLLGTMCAAICAIPVGLDEIFAGFVKNANLLSPDKQSPIVKRRVFEENPDTGLKKVSLQSLIGDLESNLYQSAVSANSAKHEQPVTQTPGGEHPITKRDAEESAKVALETSTSSSKPEASTQSLSETTTEKMSSDPKVRVPTRIIIDHISVQPHFGGDLPIIPAFQVQHTKLISATIKESGSNATHITITKANIHATKADPATAADKVDSDDQHGSSTEHQASPTEATTKKPNDDLKKAEAELNEKVAEIEAVPVILSARV